LEKENTHKWAFAPRFRANAFGWKGSRLACQRIKEAVSEIRKAARKDPVLGAEGAVKLMEKLWPALQRIDSSSGALGTAVHNAVGELVDVVVNAPAGETARKKWLDWLWDAFSEDGVGFLDVLGERWGEVCGSPETASEWADELLSPVQTTWAETRQKKFSYFRGTDACLSCLLAADRYRELLDLVEAAPYVSWHYRRYGVRALVAMGKKAEAIKYAKASCGLNDSPTAIGCVCEEILLSSGLYEEAYRQYGLAVNWGGTNLATFRKIAKKYPMKEKSQILEDLVASTPGEEGKWFAAAKSLGMLPLALKLAQKSPCDPKTLNRAARDYMEKAPDFSLGAAMASLHWLSQGWGYEVAEFDVRSAFVCAISAAEKLGVEEQVRSEIRKIAERDESMGMMVREVLKRAGGL